MAREDADWEVLALPPEIELSSKGKNQELNSIEEEGSGEVGEPRSVFKRQHPSSNLAQCRNQNMQE